MCGINGILGLQNREKAGDLIQRMNHSLRHRGPDDDGKFIEDGIALGHRRLSIIDLSSAGHQPMASFDDRYQIIYNGEIYNYRELKRQIGDYPYRSDTDTEVLLAAYIKWGVNCLQYLNGMFAFAIWDRVEKNLFVARDRLGIKPLYYFKSKNIFAFSSELRPLLNTGLIDKRINREGLVDYLRYQTVHAPKTIVDGVDMLMPGHYMLIDGTEIKEKKRYWNLSSNNETGVGNQDYESVKKTIYEKLLQSVEKRLVADVEFGAFLSGGIDSSIVVALMSKLIPGKVNTFSVTFDDQKFSEAPYSRLIAEKFNTIHSEIKISQSDFLSLLPEALQAMDHPSVDGPNTYVVSKATKNAGVTMALSGLGGDELFAGYKNFTRAYKLEKLKLAGKVPVALRSWIGTASKKLMQNRGGDKVAELFNLEKWEASAYYPILRQLYFDYTIKKLLNLEGNLSFNRVSEIIRQFYTNNSSDYLLSKISKSEISTYMQNVLLRDTDQMSMANALEVRVPFLDHELVEYTLSIKDDFKYPATPKKLLVDSMRHLIPSEVVNRPKMGFVFPWEKWLKDELKGRVTMNLENLSDRSFFNGEFLRKQWKSFLNGSSTVNWPQIWMLVVLEEWLENNEISE